MPNDLMNVREAALYIGLAKQTLDSARSRGDASYPPYTKLGSKSVRYSKADLDAWLASRRVVPSGPKEGSPNGRA